ncbi:hypothetical protein [Caballeronia sp. RCC_10]|uniref:hypothetical protein n=1 Tax=Caballeronia sp. RCC_10 TaxID=3239227 RepID=UPI003523C534
MADSWLPSWLYCKRASDATNANRRITPLASESHVCYVLFGVFPGLAQFALPFIQMDAVVAILSIKINDERSAEKQQDHRHPYHLCTSLMPSLAHSVSEITVGNAHFHRAAFSPLSELASRTLTAVVASFEARKFFILRLTNVYERMS